MAACPRCGYGNDGRAAFCANPDCRADLRPAGPGGTRVDTVPPGLDRPAPARSSTWSGWRQSRAAPPPVAPSYTSLHYSPRPDDPGPEASAGPAAPGRDGQRRGVRVTMEPAELRVEPGASASTTVTVRNNGTQVEQYRLAVDGPATSLAQVYPPELSVFPDEEQTAEVRFTAPRGSWPPAGRVAFQVVVRSEVHADVSGSVSGALTVGRFDQVEATLEPEMTRGRRPGRHRVQVMNRGNAPLRAAVAFTDRDGELSYDPPRFGVALAPGATEVGEARIGAPVRWFGRIQSLPFTATVTTDAAGPPTLLNGVRRQLPRYPWWIPPAAALALVAAVFVAIQLVPKASVPNVVQLVGSSARDTLQQAGYVPSEISTPDPTTPAGLTVRTDPAVGTAWPKGGRVLYFVSVGPCDGSCPIKVPNVVGMPVPDAQRELEAAQFVVQRVNHQQDPQPAETVLATSPSPNEQAPLHSQIVLTASSGPAPTAAPTTTPEAGAKPLPRLSGLMAAQAAAQLEALGFTVAQVPIHSNKAAAGTVLESDPPVGTPPPPGSTVTLKVAQPTEISDLLTVAPTGKWASNLGGPLTFPGTTGDGNGFVLIDPSATLEDGTTAKVLETHPYWQSDGDITGTLTLPDPVIAGDHLRAQVGFLTGSDDSVTFVVSAQGKELARVTDGGADRKLRKVDADLTSVAGATDLVIQVLAGPRGDLDLAVWKDLRIEPRIG